MNQLTYLNCPKTLSIDENGNVYWHRRRVDPTTRKLNLAIYSRNQFVAAPSGQFTIYSHHFMNFVSTVVDEDLVQVLNSNMTCNARRVLDKLMTSSTVFYRDANTFIVYARQRIWIFKPNPMAIDLMAPSFVKHFSEELPMRVSLCPFSAVAYQYNGTAATYTSHFHGNNNQIRFMILLPNTCQIVHASARYLQIHLIVRDIATGIYYEVTSIRAEEYIQVWSECKIYNSYIFNDDGIFYTNENGVMFRAAVTHVDEPHRAKIIVG